MVGNFFSTMFRFQSFKGYPGLSPEPLKSQIIMNMLGPLCYEQREWFKRQWQNPTTWSVLGAE